MSSKLVAIIAGVGAGTGASIARRFAKAYPVVLLARSPSSYNDLVTEINGAGGKAIGISTDLTDEASVKSAFSGIEKEFGSEVTAAAAIFNASGGFVKKPFLETTLEQFGAGYDVSVKGAFIFSQASLPLLLRAVQTQPQPQYSPSLIFTGATASVKAGAQLSAFNTGKHANRALSQSLAREFFPQGVHVSYAIIDGAIDIPRSKDFMKDAGPDAKISPDSIAESYWYLHTQHRSAFTWEIDLRPFVEKW